MLETDTFSIISVDARQNT